ncbi:FAD-dependent oxidoreductase [Rhodococcus cercidiphylli]|jgi:succinate dehydrogenase/fumarate reductase flavoprotein subunit|uniref:FAD-binding protein n=1 Tax=Rhodococcus cercidiphylli TaxID=489916 RepID=A0ABU4AUZ7_9NOCA|nr:FAD-binding protein [Rhodococcus cercidiphylli]MDV6230060.1 FAD-binding protein [Rhodococcus cercidiphylli]
MSDEVFDLLVIGAGMAGLTAAAKSARNGKKVCLVEVGGDIGGSARFAGYAWTAPTHEIMNAENPRGDATLKRALVDRFADGVEWIRSVGIDVDNAQRILDFGGQGHKFDTNHYIDTCRRIVTEAGGELVLRADTESLLLENGTVAGATVRVDGAIRQFRSPNTLLATGGFQGDKDLLAEHVHPDAGKMQLRSNPTSCGAGYRLASAVGASTGSEDAGFYGHLIPSGVELSDPSDFVDMSLYYSEHALLFNLNNERFVDETLGDHLTTMALLDQPESRGLLIADARVHRDWMLASYVEGAIALDKFDLGNKRGGRVGMAEDLEEFEYMPEEWGYEGKVIAAAIAEFNRAADAGEHLSPARARDRSSLAAGPYYFIEAAPAVTFPFHGIRIDDRARVLNKDGVPIAGLLAAGSDTGGLWHRAYAGGIASALVFGLTAADTAC